MINYLSVKNIALIESAEIEFENGLNVLTGETGAGKSILLDAIGLLLGNRIDKTLLRNGETECKVVGRFSVDNSAHEKYFEYCEKYDLARDEEVIVSRSYKIDGKNDIRLNGSPITLGMLKELCSFLVDSYGQNENQFIFDASNHLKILDNFAKIDKYAPFVEYQGLYSELLSINKQLKQFGGNDKERLRSIDILSYQLQEIEDAAIRQDEYESLLDKRHKMLNLGKIVSNTITAQNILDDGIAASLSKAKSAIQQAAVYDEKLSEYSQRLESAGIEIQDILDSLKDYNNEVDFSEADEQKLEDRLSVYNKLLRKYGKTVQEVLENKAVIESELFMLKNADKEIEKLTKQKNECLSKMYKLGAEISEFRREKSADLCAAIVQNLQNLSIKNAKLQFQFSELQNDESLLYNDGMDRAELLFSANLGESLKPLNKIASGGEISRFMLALKAVIAECDQMPTMIFDEIDTGISGVTSEAVAKQMATIAKSHQVIVVTHAHQIASMADTNFLIKKRESNGRTITLVEKLDEKQKIQEIARFLSGDKLTESSLKNAEQLVVEQNEYKNSI